MGSPLGSDSAALRPGLVALALGAATLVIILRGATRRGRPARVESTIQSSRHLTSLDSLEAVYRRGDITPEDYGEIRRLLSGR